MISPENIDSIEEVVKNTTIPKDQDFLVSKLQNSEWLWLLVQILFEDAVKQEKTVKPSVFSSLNSYDTYDSCSQFLALVSDDFKKNPELLKHSRWPIITRLATRHLVALRKNTEHPEFKRIMPCRVALPPSDVIKDVFETLSDPESPVKRDISEAFCPRGNWASRRPNFIDSDFFYFCVAIMSQENGHRTENKDRDIEESMRLRKAASEMERSSFHMGFDDQEKEPEESIRVISRYSRGSVLLDRFELFIALREDKPSWIAKVDGKLVYFYDPETESVLFHTDVEFDRAMSICRGDSCKTLVFTDGEYRTDTFSMDETLEIMDLAKGLAEYEFTSDLNYLAYFDRMNSRYRSIQSNF